MTRQSKEIYRTGNAPLDLILSRIAHRLDQVEGLKPDLPNGFLYLSNKTVTTITDFEDVPDDDVLNLGSMAGQDASDVDITGGNISGYVLIDLYDVNDTIIHTFSIENLTNNQVAFQYTTPPFPVPYATFADVTGSRAVGTIYQNTTSFIKICQIIVKLEP